MARYRPRAPIIAVTRNPQTARQAHLYRGIFPVVCKDPVQSAWAEDVDLRVNLAMNVGAWLGARTRAWGGGARLLGSLGPCGKGTMHTLGCKSPDRPHWQCSDTSIPFFESCSAAQFLSSLIQSRAWSKGSWVITVVHSLASAHY